MWEICQSYFNGRPGSRRFDRDPFIFNDLARHRVKLPYDEAAIRARGSGPTDRGRRHGEGQARPSGKRATRTAAERRRRDFQSPLITSGPLPAVFS